MIPFKSMPDEIALDFILYQILPDNAPLGYHFEWFQPSEDSTITLGSIYVSCDLNLSPYDLFFYQLGYPDYKYESSCTEYPLWAIKTLLKAYKDTQQDKTKRVKLLKRKISGILELENPHCQFSELEREEKLLYRLAIMALNTMTEAHNWACLYLKSLAYDHYLLKDQGKDWQFYCPDESDNTDILLAINDLFSSSNCIADKLELYGYTIDNANSGEEYYYFNQWENENLETQEYIKSIIDSLDNHPLQKWDIRDYDHEIISTLAHMINWIKEEWINGNLFFTLSPEMPKKLYNWYREYTYQLILPNID